MKKRKLSPEFIGVMQAVGFLVYASGVAWLMLNGNQIFGQIKTFLGPLVFLSLFVFSAIFSASVLLGYPFYVFWEKKDLKTAFKIVASSAVSLLVFIILTLLIFSL